MAALTIALFVNAAILVLAAIVFNGKDAVQLPGGAVLQYDEQTKMYTDPATGREIAKYDEAAKTVVDPKTGEEIPDNKLADFKRAGLDSRGLPDAGSAAGGRPG